MTLPIIIRRLHARSAALWLLFAAVIAPLAAGKADPRDHDAVRLAVARGEIRPLADILAAVREKLPGNIAGVEVERRAGRWLYEFRVVDGTGRLFEVYVNAQSAEIERIKEK